MWIKAKYAGKQGACPNCQRTMQVPGTPVTPEGEGKRPAVGPGQKTLPASGGAPSVKSSAVNAGAKASTVVKPSVGAKASEASAAAKPAAAKPASGQKEIAPPVSVEAPTPATRGTEETELAGEYGLANAYAMADAPAAEDVREPVRHPLIRLDEIPRWCRKGPAHDRRLQAAMLVGLDEELAAPRVRVLHLLAGCTIALLLVLLPILYVLVVLGLIAAAVGLCVALGAMLQKVRVRYALLLFAAPLGLLMGALCMVKPLFRRRRRAEAVYSRRFVNPVSEPLLWQFVEGVCDSVGAVRPDRIEIVTGPEAMASWMGFWRKQYVLTIGLPLLGSLTAEEFAGLVAHEVGHFRQGLSCFLARLIGGVNGWFFTVVYERDDFDYQVEQWAEEGFFWSLLSMTARAGAYVGRGLLFCLGMAGMLVSQFMSRQQEFDADRYWCRVAGAKSFASAMRKIWYLGMADSISQDFLGACLDQGYLPDDSTRVSLGILRCFSRESIAKAEAERKKQRTKWLDTHPEDEVRVANAVREGHAGIYHVQHPAAWLLKDFEGLCRQLTRETYEQVLGERFSPALVHPVERFAGGKRPEPLVTSG
jgi:Zn-dependent protease with chaperone function